MRSNRKIGKVANPRVKRSKFLKMTSNTHRGELKIARKTGVCDVGARTASVGAPNVGDGVSFPFRLYRGRWKAESFMKVHRVPVVTHLSRCNEGGNGAEEEARERETEREIGGGGEGEGRRKRKGSPR